jgi:hypothetical protein
MHEQRANGRVPLRAHANRQTTTSQQAVQPRYAKAMVDQQTHQWEDDLEDDPAYYPARRPSSAVRYTDAHGRPVLQNGKRRYVLGSGKPPRKRSWLFSLGLGMLMMILLVVGGNWLTSSVQAWHLSATYGFPPTWQTDEDVGHEQGKSHFLFENLNGHIFFEEIPEGDDFKHAVLYSVTVLYGPDAAQVPVTATFADVNHDGKLDILIHLGDQTIVYLNTGTGFQPAQ